MSQTEEQVITQEVVEVPAETTEAKKTLGKLTEIKPMLTKARRNKDRDSQAEATAEDTQ